MKYPQNRPDVTIHHKTMCTMQRCEEKSNKTPWCIGWKMATTLLNVFKPESIRTLSSVQTSTLNYPEVKELVLQSAVSYLWSFCNRGNKANNSFWVTPTSHLRMGSPVGFNTCNTWIVLCWHLWGLQSASAHQFTAWTVSCAQVCYLMISLAVTLSGKKGGFWYNDDLCFELSLKITQKLQIVQNATAFMDFHAATPLFDFLCPI